MRRVTSKGIVGTTAGLAMLGGVFFAGHELWPSSETKVETTFDVDAGIKKIHDAAQSCASTVINAAGAHFDFESVNDPSTPEDEDNKVYEQAKNDGQSYVDTEYTTCMAQGAEEAIHGDLSDLQAAIDEANIPPVFTPSLINLIEVTPTTKG